jgi:hypothetical protein
MHFSQCVPMLIERMESMNQKDAHKPLARASDVYPFQNEQFVVIGKKVIFFRLVDGFDGLR